MTSGLIVKIFWFQTVVSSHFAPTLALHVPMWICLFHRFWRHKVPWESWGCTKCVWLIFLRVFFHLNIFLRRWPEFGSQPFIAADVPDLHKLSMKVVFKIGFLVSREKLLDFWGVSTILLSVESDHKNILFSLRDIIFNLWDFFTICNHDAGVTVVLPENIFKSRNIFVWYERDYIPHII